MSMVYLNFQFIYFISYQQQKIFKHTMKQCQILQNQYQSIQSIQELEKIKLQFEHKIEQIIKQIHDLNTKKIHQNTQHQIIKSKMLGIMNSNKKKVVLLQTNIQKITQQQQIRIKEQEEIREKERKYILMVHQSQMDEEGKKIMELQQQQKIYKQFQEKEAFSQQQIHEMEKSLTEKQYDHHDKMNIEKQRQHELNQMLVEENYLLMKETKKNAVKVAIQKVLEEKQCNLQTNQVLRNKLFNLQEELSKLKRQRDQVLQKQKDIKMNSCLNDDQLEQYKAVGSLQKSKIKNNQEKLQNLKKYMDLSIENKKTKISDRKKETQNIIKTIKLKIQNMKHTLNQLRSNGDQLNILGQTILVQRKQVQDFFIIAMQKSKLQTQSYQHNPSQQKQYGDRVDIDQLLPKDRQRIIINLYTKLALTPN